MIAVEADDVVGDDAAEELLDERLQLGIHLLQLGDKIGEELGHVLLFPGVQRLLVHRVHFAKVLGVVGFAFRGGEKGEEFLRKRSPRKKDTDLRKMDWSRELAKLAAKSTQSDEDIVKMSISQL